MDKVGNGKRLRELRGQKSRREVAEALHISESALAMYELGERNPRDETKEAISNFYGVSIGDIFYPGKITTSD